MTCQSLFFWEQIGKILLVAKVNYAEKPLNTSWTISYVHVILLTGEQSRR